jgi:hypothetical protein
MKKIGEYAKNTAVVILALYVVMNPQETGEAIYNAVQRCLTVIIPSLYAMMIISGILGKSRISDSITGIFIFSQFAGYPVGTKMICEKYSHGEINRRRAEIFSGVCFGAGPSFVSGCIASRLYGSPHAGYAILLSGITANTIVFIAMMIIFRDKQKNRHTDGFSLTGIIINSGYAMGNICIMITAFSVIESFLNHTGIISVLAEIISFFSDIPVNYAEGIISALIDVTAVEKIPAGNYEILPIISGIVSFGGICVAMQIYSAVDGKISIKPLIFIRIAIAVLSGIICRIIMPFILSGETVSVSSVNVSLSHESTVIPSILLIIMTIWTISEMQKNHQP